MMMTDDELRGSMRKAADKRAQVGILAELNAVSEDQMRAKLQELGVAVPGKKPRTTRVLDPEQALALIGQGLTDAARAFEDLSRRVSASNDAPALCGPAEVVPAWAVTVGGRPALYLSRRELADAVQAIIDLDVELRRCRDDHSGAG